MYKSTSTKVTCFMSSGATFVIFFFISCFCLWLHYKSLSSRMSSLFQLCPAVSSRGIDSSRMIIASFPLQVQTVLSTGSNFSNNISTWALCWLQIFSAWLNNHAQCIRSVQMIYDSITKCKVIDLQPSLCLLFLLSVHE